MVEKVVKLDLNQTDVQYCTRLDVSESSSALEKMTNRQEMDCGLFKMICGFINEEKVLVVNGANGVSVAYKS